MNRKPPNDPITRLLKNLKNRGDKVVSIEALENYIQEVNDNPSEIELAEFNAKQQALSDRYKEEKAEWRELFKATVLHAQSAIRLQAITNGGAAVALLAFTGQIWTPHFGATAIAEHLPIALLLYTAGVGSAALTQSLTYLSQNSFTYDNSQAGNLFKYISQFTAASSLGLFFAGTYYTYTGLSI